MSGAPLRHAGVGLGGGIAAPGAGVGLGRPPTAGGAPDAGPDGPDADASADPATLSWTADRIVLYRSILGRGPAQHLALATALLGR